MLQVEDVQYTIGGLLNGRDQGIQMMLDIGADVNAQGGGNGNSLHVASKRGGAG